MWIIMLPQTAVHWLSSAKIGAAFGAEQFMRFLMCVLVPKTSDFLYVCKSAIYLTSLLKLGYLWIDQVLNKLALKKFWRHSCLCISSKNFRFLVLYIYQFVNCLTSVLKLGYLLKYPVLDETSFSKFLETFLGCL